MSTKAHPMFGVAAGSGAFDLELVGWVRWVHNESERWVFAHFEGQADGPKELLT